ncbi:acyl-CoA dehydrogenase NM domain-like protein [Epithele typhae]|uniref:acyl-CoA dehydrogenase NM domain-like protein n=1 Tax=Epithele typhae TaxID=378194 RepID=UPI0020077A32|nr:acyl-CoA dehydrogenase NM domain-like protein [Epithele typhae]KAH9942406.1 acyl-CoA dehydrogenase NM domain-like protein [Epithele typhae]
MSSSTASRRTSHLPETSLFSRPVHSMDPLHRALLSYEKARAIGLSYRMTLDDVHNLTPKFWDMHSDPATAMDPAATTLLTIQYNLCAGTIALYSKHRPELVSLVDDLLRYRKHGQYMLTEIGHGLDISNIETTATLLPSGEFLLHSPTPQASKFMPPTVPAGQPCNRGHRPFIVALNDGKKMCTGVTSKLLPFRDGAQPVTHSITTFTNVRLSHSALLGSLDMPANLHDNLMHITSRICVGTVALGSIAIPFMELTRLSARSTPSAPDRCMPILTFRTQQIPLVGTVADVHVLRALHRSIVQQFCSERDARVRRGLAAVFKSVMVQHSQQDAMGISERCGAQGLFAHNQIIALTGMRGVAIAEGDILGLAIRLVNELLLDRYQLPKPADPNSLLARREAVLFSELRAAVAAAGGHRSKAASRIVLPACQPAVEAIGHRMAYDAAVAQGVEPALIDLYVANCVRLDPAFYVEHGLGRAAQQAQAADAHDRVLPLLGELVRAMDVAEYVRAPIISDERWGAFVEGLTVYEGDAYVDAFDGHSRTEELEMEFARL